MLTPENVLLAALVGCLVLPWLLQFVAAPVRMRARSWQAADPVYTPDDEDRLSPTARLVAADLRAMGFEDRGTWRHDGAALATGHVILLEHPRTRDTAKVMVVTARTRRSLTLVFQTRFADGTEAVTANSRVIAGFPPLPGVTVAWLPEFRDAASLYRVHAQLRDALGGARERVGIGADPAAFLRDGSARSLANWVASGYYALDAVRGVVRPTWKGAALITWRLLWPVKPLFRARRRRATRRLLDRLGVSWDR
ncbi:MAG TPA: hypothetical protein VKE74_21985 [Gemmataceae bacterium]|nr:hypothetical protein [Gemmataceae bacterium]